MRKLTKRELTQELRKRSESPIYDVVVKEYYWSTNRSTLAIAAENEIEAARYARECKDVNDLYSITLREGVKVWA